MAERVSASYLLSSTILAGAKRVAGHYLLTAVPLAGLKEVTVHQLVTAAPFAGAKIVDAHYMVTSISIHNMFELIRLESNSEIYGTEFGFGFDTELVAGPIPEFNPYKPQVPESLIEIPGSGRDLFDYIEENQKTLRLQHNITQAGDTTFPYQMIINSHDEKQFTLGAIGRFYHEDYGIILARYVQYEKMNQTLRPTAPVGLIKVTGNLDWIVTNRLEISDPHLVVGVQAAYVMPKDKQFGWVTVDGVNLQPFVTEGDNTTIGTPYVWSAAGKVGPAGPGIVVCRRLQEGGDVTLLKGRALIRLEGASFGSIDVHFAQLLADFEQLKEDVQSLKDANNLADTIKIIQTNITKLGSRINTEQNARQAADTAINNRIDALNAISPAMLAAAITALETSIAAIALGLSNRIDATNAIAVEALQKANQALAIDIGVIQTQISNILVMIVDERVRLKGKFPIVDGAVPPNLVYLDDGSLVYEETF